MDEEAKAILAELDASQAEVQQMLADQKVQTNELGGLRDSLVNEVRIVYLYTCIMQVAVAVDLTMAL